MKDQQLRKIRNELEQLKKNQKVIVISVTELMGKLHIFFSQYGDTIESQLKWMNVIEARFSQLLEKNLN